MSAPNKTKKMVEKGLFFNVWRPRSGPNLLMVLSLTIPPIVLTAPSNKFDKSWKVSFWWRCFRHFLQNHFCSRTIPTLNWLEMHCQGQWRKELIILIQISHLWTSRMYILPIFIFAVGYNSPKVAITILSMISSPQSFPLVFRADSGGQGGEHEQHQQHLCWGRWSAAHSGLLLVFLAFLVFLVFLCFVSGGLFYVVPFTIIFLARLL